MTSIALDLGTKRTGVAIGVGNDARPYTTLDNQLGLAEQLASICQDEGIDLVVIGLPLNEDGSPSAQSEWVELESAKIRQFLHLPVVLEDEYLTSYEARRQLTEMGLPKEEIERQVDQYSAKLILEQYLNNKNIF